LECPCSIGVGENILMASLALKKAKPNGLFIAPSTAFGSSSQSILEWIREFDLKDLPLIGWSNSRALQNAGIHSIADIQDKDESALIDLLGPTNGKKLYRFAQGIDDRVLEPFQ